MIAMAAITMLEACGNDPEEKIDASVSDEDGVKTSSFAIDASTWGIGNMFDENHELVLVPHGCDTAVSFPANLQIENSKVRCTFTIAHPRKIDDGVYYLYLFGSNGARTGNTLVVKMNSEKLDEIISVQRLYKPLTGTGTEDDPFIISKQSDFMSLIVDLDNESGVHGKGLHYRQTADFDVPPQSSMTAGRGYYSTPFAGHYDGGGHKLTGLSYTGAMNYDRDSKIGLFSELLSGAVVENICIEGLDISYAMTCGAIAGRSSGTVTLRNISATGNINTPGDCVGGLVGSVSGSLTVADYEMNMTLSGNKYVGGVAGNVLSEHTSSAHLKVSGLSTEKHRFRITGSSSVGGVAGEIQGSVFLENVSIDHSIQSEDQDVTIITAQENANAGGLIGYFFNNAESTFKNVEILAPVHATEYTGGLVGQCMMMQPLIIDGCKVSTVISGENYTGGFFGALQYNEGLDSKMRSLVFSGDGSKLITDFNAGEVKGDYATGGLAGSYKGPAPEFQSTLTIAMNITATGNATGGLFGLLSRSLDSVLDVSKIDFSSNTMKISSKGNYVGGIAGNVSSYAIKGPANFSLHKDEQAVTVDVEGMKPLFRAIIDGSDYVGGIAGRVSGTLMEGFVISASVSGYNYVGGIAGEWKDTSNSLSMCALQSNSSVYAKGDCCGGIAGSLTADAKGSFHDCINRGAVKGNDYTGGIAGRILYSEEFNPCWLVNTGSVNGTGSTAGIVGRAEGDWVKLIIENCANYGTVTANSEGGDGVAGVIGCSHSQRVHVISCANHGLIDCSGSGGAVGGVAGCLGHDPGGVSQGENLFMAYCMNSGEVRCSDKNKNVGGILGFQEEGTSSRHDDYCVRDCYNDGHISSDQNDDNGGLIGKVSHYSYTLRCVNYGKVDYGNACIGTRQNSCIFYNDYLYHKDGSGKSWSSSGSIPESALADQSRYPTFDFKNTWHTDNGRAELRKCPWQYIRSY